MTESSERNQAGIELTGDERNARRHRTDDADGAKTRQAAIDLARLLHARHFEDIVMFDVRGMSDMTDYILIATGTSDRQIKAVGHEVEDLAKEAGFRRFGREVDGPTTWLVVDFVDIVVHLFEAVTRAHYDLEMMWDDAPKVVWKP